MRRCATPNMRPRCIATSNQFLYGRRERSATGEQADAQQGALGARGKIPHRQDFAAGDAILVHSWSGAPLEQEHGGPVRLVVPHLYFWKSAKWLQSIEFLAEDAPGYWEVRGYHNRGDPWQEERYSGD